MLSNTPICRARLGKCRSPGPARRRLPDGLFSSGWPFPLDESGHRTIGRQADRDRHRLQRARRQRSAAARSRPIPPTSSSISASMPRKWKTSSSPTCTTTIVGQLDRFPKARFHLQGQGDAVRHRPARLPQHFRHAFEIEDIVGMVRGGLRQGGWSSTTATRRSSPHRPLHLIGGHTHGHAVGRVMTRNGWLVLASDASHYYWASRTRSCSPIVYSVAGHAGGLRQAAEAGRRPARDGVPGHDAAVMTRYPASKPGLEGVSVRLD